MTQANNFQRVGASSNAAVGREFEDAAQKYFQSLGLSLQRDFKVEVGYKIKKPHRFDLGNDDPAVLVECKSFTWTSGGNSPAAKIRGLNEVMLYFSVSPPHFRKILFLLKHMRREVSLATHYLKTQGHLIGPGVQIFEFDLESKTANQLL
jgi:hypothetical protein